MNLNKTIKKSNLINLYMITVLILVFWAAAGCQSETATTTAPQEAATAETQLAAVVETAVPTPVNVSTNDNLLAVSDVLAQETAVVDECLACHIDKEQLIATADPEEEVINENEGEG